MQGKITIIMVYSFVSLDHHFGCAISRSIMVFCSVITVMIKEITAKSNSQRKRCANFCILA